jgi:Ca2+-binding EF-hand superfamily protein
MKRNINLILVAAILLLATFQTMAQRPEGEPGQRRGGFGGPDAMARMNPLFAALDANQDGEIDSTEINNAVAALKKLDKNSDGKIDVAEVRPEFGGRGEFGGDRGGRGGQGPGQGGNLAERIMQFDSNKDGKVTKEELPERMARMMERLDANSDGAITKEELENTVNQRGGREGGGRPQAPQRGQ